MTRILTKNGVDNTNIDGARNYNFNAGRRSGIVKCKKVGKEVYYTLDDDHVRKEFEIGLEHINHKL